MSATRAWRSFSTGTLGVVAAATVLLVAALGFASLGRTSRALGHPLPILGRVVDFALVDQTSAPVGRAALDGAPWVASFVFTRCPLVCPRLSERMRTLQELAEHRTAPLRLVTFSVDPEHDVPDVLRRYAEAYGADRARWRFLTGSEAQVTTIARSFSVALDGEADPSKADFGIMHSGHLVLVDGRGRIRGYYPSSEDGVERRILTDLERLEPS
jgi:protein SCO1/2